MTEHLVVLVDGTHVVFALESDGDCEVEDFLDSLDARYRARFNRYFERLDRGLPIKSPENFRRLNVSGEPPVFELKVDKYRLYMIKQGVRWYVTHGRDKPKDNRVNAEAQKARAKLDRWEEDRDEAST